MELNETVELMESDDYRDRFKAEYYQTKERYTKLRAMCVKYEAGTLDFEPKCPLSLLNAQARYMDNYLKALEVRAQLENIEL